MPLTLHVKGEIFNLTGKNGAVPGGGSCVPAKNRGCDNLLYGKYVVPFWRLPKWHPFDNHEMRRKKKSYGFEGGVI